VKDSIGDRSREAEIAGLREGRSTCINRQQSRFIEDIRQGNSSADDGVTLEYLDLKRRSGLRTEKLEEIEGGSRSGDACDYNGNSPREVVGGSLANGLG